MAAGRLPKPGTQYGPCRAKCLHLDCETTRAEAASSCAICGKTIGYETPFYQRDSTEGATKLRNASGKPYELVHAECAEIEAEKSR